MHNIFEDFLKGGFIMTRNKNRNKNEENIKLRDHGEATKKLYENRPDVKEKIEENPDPMLEIRSQLLELRMEKDLTQKQLAEKADTKQTIISRLERGANQPNIKTLQKVARALDKKVKIKFED